MGFILIQYAPVFVFLFSWVRVKMEGNCVCCASRPATIRKWALSSLWKQQQPCGLSIFMPERGWKLFFKVTFSLSGKRLNTARAQMIGTLLSLKWHRAQQQHSMTLYLIFFFFQSICSKMCHVWPTLICFVALEILPYYSPLQTAVLLEIANPSSGERCQRDARVCLI